MDFGGLLDLGSTNSVVVEWGTAGALPISAEISRNGGSFAPAAGTVSEVGNGYYSLSLSADETDTEGPLIVRFTKGSTAVAIICHVYDLYGRTEFASGKAVSSRDTKTSESIVSSQEEMKKQITSQVNRVLALLLSR